MTRAGATRASFVAAALAVFAGTSWAEDAAPRPIASYARFELRDLRAQVEVQPKVIDKIATELKLRLDEPLARWNEEGSQPGHAGTLAIEVEITQMKFVSGGQRFFARAMAGGSSCVATAKLIEAESGRMLARKVFGEMSSAQKGAHTMGASDNLMLDRLAAAIGSWVIEQHSQLAPAAELAPEPAPAS